MNFEATFENKKYSVQIEKQDGIYHIAIDDKFHKKVSDNWKNILVIKHKVFHTAANYVDKGRFRTFVNGKTVRLELHSEQEKLRKSLEVVDEENVLSTSMPGKITKIMVKPEDAVKKGQSLIIMEAMKMENILKAPCDGKISQIHVKSGDNVEAGITLVTLDAGKGKKV
ncbi:MAG TPA: biotin/lipoyl-containing protein [Bdellovibrionota bacterium]|nr:biotin/lipoyl-containing protein [Bdellovibrionota bacterium]